MPSQDNHIMIDLECLGTSKDCVIVSVGAVKFNLNTGVIVAQEYWELNTKEQQQKYFRTIDADTVRWWANQTPETLKAIQSTHNRVSITRFMEDFDRFIEGPNYFWAKGTNYDLEILTDLYTRSNLLRPRAGPFKYSKWVDARVYYLLGKELGIMPNLTNEGAHNALADALFQVKVVTTIHKTLKNSLQKSK